MDRRKQLQTQSLFLETGKRRTSTLLITAVSAASSTLRWLEPLSAPPLDWVIADHERARNQDAQACALARESGVMDELQLEQNQMCTPEEIQHASQRITRRREQGEGQTTRTQELDVIDTNNVPLIAQVESGERIADGERTANVGMNRDNNQITLTVSDNKQSTVRRGQDIDSSLTLADLNPTSTSPNSKEQQGRIKSQHRTS